LSVYGSTQLSPNNSQINYNSDHDFIWTYNGTTTQSHYQVYIYRNSDNLLIHDSTKITSATPTHTVPSGTLTNNTLYKWKVVTYSGSDSATSNWSLFTCASNPTFTLGATPTNVQTFQFSVLYNQAELIPIKWYRFYLYLSSNPTEVLDDSEVLYPDSLVSSSATPLTHIFDGLISGNTYKIQAIGENQLGYSLDTGLSSDFTITYVYPPDIPALETTIDNDSGAITLNWLALVQKLGFVTGSYSYVDGRFDKGVQLDAGTILNYPTETIPDDFTTYLWVNLPTGYIGTIIQFGEDSENGMKISFDGSKFIWSHGDFITCGRNVSGVLGNFVLLGIKYRKLIIQSLNHEETIDI
jgi:hypothetical protein